MNPALDVASPGRRVHYRRPRYPQRRIDELPSRVRFVIEAVAERHGVSPENVLAQDRRQKVCGARTETAYLLRQMQWRGGRPSYPAIGRWLGKDHTTIIYAVRRYEATACQ